MMSPISCELTIYVSATWYVTPPKPHPKNHFGELLTKRQDFGELVSQIDVSYEVELEYCHCNLAFSVGLGPWTN